MSKTGPPRKPTKLKLLQGTYRKDFDPIKREAEPEAAVPSIPEHLSAEAKIEWERIAEELNTLGLLSRIDRAALAAYCECWADWVESSRLCMTTDGHDRKVIKTAAGNFVENPYFSIKKRSAELMHKFLTEFGMTPASRTRINTLVKEPNSSSGPIDAKDYA